MKKILAVFDSTRYSEGASKYAMEIAKASNAMLVGVFIQDMRYLNYTYAYAWDQPFIDFSSIQESEHEDGAKTDLNIQLFHRACDEKGVHHKVHLDKGVPLQELLRESIFADMIIIDSHTSFFSMGGGSPSPFLKDLLVDSHCPVLIVPNKYVYFDNTVLCYDGSPSSVYAVKMFSYLFPELDEMKTTLLTVNEKANAHLTEARNMKDLLHAHYKNMEYEIIAGESESAIIDYLKQAGENTIVVMGAYGRNAISRFLHQSLSNRVIQEVNVPVFIAHQ